MVPSFRQDAAAHGNVPPVPGGKAPSALRSGQPLCPIPESPIPARSAQRYAPCFRPGAQPQRCAKLDPALRSPAGITMNPRLTLALAIALASRRRACQRHRPRRNHCADARQPFFAPRTLPYSCRRSTKSATSTTSRRSSRAEGAAGGDCADCFEQGRADLATPCRARPQRPDPLRVSNVFSNLSGANTNDTMESIQVDMAPKLAAHRMRSHWTARSSLV